VSDGIKIQKVSGSFTNAVFFVSYPSNLFVRTLLLRIYGSSSGSLISRPRELQTLYSLSSKYHIGPRVYGTFENGRFEEYFNSLALTASDIRNKHISRWIGARMAELHQVDIDDIEGFSAHHEDGARKNVRSWISPAQRVLALPAVNESVRASLNLDAFVVQWEKYMQWMKDVESKEGASKQVFSHNDAQYGNLLRLAKREEGVPEHRQVRYDLFPPRIARFCPHLTPHRSSSSTLNTLHQIQPRSISPITSKNGHPTTIHQRLISLILLDTRR
jgi:choline kinase